MNRFIIEINSMIGLGMVEFCKEHGFEIVEYLKNPGGDYLDYITVQQPYSNRSLPAKFVELLILNCGIHRDQFKITK